MQMRNLICDSRIQKSGDEQISKYINIVFFFFFFFLQISIPGIGIVRCPAASGERKAPSGARRQVELANLKSKRRARVLAALGPHSRAGAVDS